MLLRCSNSEVWDLHWFPEFPRGTNHPLPIVLMCLKTLSSLVVFPFLRISLLAFPDTNTEVNYWHVYSCWLLGEPKRRQRVKGRRVCEEGGGRWRPRDLVRGCGQRDWDRKRAQRQNQIDRWDQIQRHIEGKKRQREGNFPVGRRAMSAKERLDEEADRGVQIWPA